MGAHGYKHAHTQPYFDDFIFALCYSILKTVICKLQNMYEEGDDEMKQTIAKAWSDARSGKTADPLKGYH